MAECSITDTGYACNEDYRCNTCQSHDDVEGIFVAALRRGDAEECDGDTAFYRCGTDGVEVLCNIKCLHGLAIQ